MISLRILTYLDSELIYIYVTASIIFAKDTNEKKYALVDLVYVFVNIILSFRGLPMKVDGRITILPGFSTLPFLRKSNENGMFSIIFNDSENYLRLVLKI